MIDEFDKVRIKSNGVVGVVVDIHDLNGEKVYIIESDEKGCVGGYGSDNGWKLFDCDESDLEEL